MPSTMIIKPKPVEAAQRPGGRPKPVEAAQRPGGRPKPVEAAQRPGGRPKPVEAAQRPGERPTPVEVGQRPGERPKPVRAKASSGAESELQGSAVRKSRASCTQDTPVRGRSQRATTEQGPTSKPSCDRRVRSTSCAPRPTENGFRTNPTPRRATSCIRQGAVNQESRDVIGCPVQREKRAARTEPKVLIQSNKAFTVIPPNPKKRREIQRKAEAELAALEELRLSRAMAYVSIDPSRVGGCMSLEEVRLKQQQEMMQAKRKHSQIKKQVIEETPVLTR